jgi:hypothetical protein
VKISGEKEIEKKKIRGCLLPLFGRKRKMNKQDSHLLQACVPTVHVRVSVLGHL